MNALEFRNVHKSFGSNHVLRGLDFSVAEGCVSGFLGLNGAGKTTAMKLALGLLRPDSGEIYVCGERVVFGSSSASRHIGWLPDVPEYYKYMKPSEYLGFCGRLSGMDKSVLAPRISEMLALVGLDGAERKIGGFSRGMKQRLGIAQALLARPKLLICDEPTSALDPAGRREILDILALIRRETTVVFSTHILPDADSICDEIAILHGGRIAVSGKLNEIRASHGTDAILLGFATEEETLRFTSLSGLPFRTVLRGGRITIPNSDSRKTMAALIKLLDENNMVPACLEIAEPTLEMLFAETVGVNGSETQRKDKMI